MKHIIQKARSLAVIAGVLTAVALPAMAAAQAKGGPDRTALPIADVGVNEATPVTDAYKEGDNRFTGKIHKVTVDV